MKRLSQQDLLRHMVRIEWTQAMLLVNSFRSGSVRVAMRPALHDGMPDCDKSLRRRP